MKASDAAVVRVVEVPDFVLSSSSTVTGVLEEALLDDAEFRIVVRWL
jgi:hypothetical protein